MGSSRMVKPQMKCRGIRNDLASAVPEWILICLLFIEAMLSYLIKEFVSYYELQRPCFLCSRIDHVFDGKNLKYYYDLICGKHKMEISSLVLGHAHDNLIDIHGMCEGCLFSFGTISKSNAETYRLLTRKLEEGSGIGLNEDCLLGDDTSSIQRLFCCNELWIPRGNGKNLMQTNTVDEFAPPSEKIPVEASVETDIFYDIPPFDAEETLEGALKETSAARETPGEASELGKTGAVSATVKETASETNPVSGNKGQQTANILELGDANKLSAGNKERQFSGVLVEQRSGKDSSKLNDDLEISSQLSAAPELTIDDTNHKVPECPRLSVNSEDLKNSDASSLIESQLLQKTISLERNESGPSLEGSIVSEIEGESPADCLKKQIEHDRDLLNALYKELEEERNASEISANQAMAMINRLQEEKAALQMEAFQYQRMMEEQAEYDSEALEKTNDLLSEREKEIQDLEAELEFYRNYQSESPWQDNMEQFSATKPEDNEDEDWEETSSSTTNEDEDSEAASSSTTRLEKSYLTSKECDETFHNGQSFRLPCVGMKFLF